MDYYLQNPERLEGQPKRAIAEYVAQNGILVPRRFDSLADARRSHRPIFLRSKHVQEYNGVSGLLESFRLSNKFYKIRGQESIEDIKGKFFESKGKTKDDAAYLHYCELMCIPEEKFREDVSFSIWEAIGGVNRAVVADTAIAGRYHVFSSYGQQPGSFYSYSVVDQFTSVQEYFIPLPAELKNGLRGLIESYEKIRHLGRFDPNHCPIMEFQTYRNKDYFLQYHRGRDFSASTFIIEGPPQPDEIEVPFVRGATGKEGIDCKVTIFYANWENREFDPQNEDGSYDFHYDSIFTELNVRKRRVQFISYRKIEDEIFKLIVHHLPRSILFKPEISLFHNLNDIICDKEIDILFESTKSGSNSFINWHVLSDGRNARIRRI